MYDPNKNAQNPETLLGSILRIDVRGQQTYRIPPDNPFVDEPGFRPEIWAYGLRNPWRSSFDPFTGDLFIADVGQAALEEISIQPADSPGGENYGWPFFEADTPINSTPLDIDRSQFVFPIYDYAHLGVNCSIAGGPVYRGDALAELQGRYFFGDFCSGSIWTLTRVEVNWQHDLFMETDFQISTFGEDVDGDLYVADWGAGAVWMLGK